MGTYLIHDLFNVETDGADWPKGLTAEDKTGLVAIVVEILRESGPLDTYLLHNAVKRVCEREGYKRVPTFKGAALLDWTYGAVVRAARHADCSQRWHLPAT